VAGGRTVSEGAVGVLIGGGVEVGPMVSQGARPYGRSFTVTRSDRNLLQEVAGMPALQTLVDQISNSLLPEEVLDMESGGFHIGLLVDEHLEEPDRGDYLVRTLVGVDHLTGALSLDGPVPVGSTVRFHRRDPVTARLDLVDLLAGQRADGALVFTCNGRGTRFFDEPDHDAVAVADRFGPVAVGGFFAAGEIGPVGGVNFVHTFATSMALFRDR
jgi:small ligand-binding sensory domain FIST